MTGETAVIERTEGGGVLAANALAGVEEVRAYLGWGEGEGDDGLIIGCINEASEWIERVTGRCFKKRECVEFVALEVGDCEGGRRVRLKNGPVVGGAVVHAGPCGALEVRRVHEALEATVSTTREGVVLRWVDALGGEREVVVGYEGKETVRELAREISCVGGWSASALGGWGPAFLIPGQVEDAQGKWGGRLMACTREVACRVTGEGVLVVERGVRRAGVLRVGYRAGSCGGDVPREVRELCVRMAGRGVGGK
jgi:hypothetical protein